MHMCVCMGQRENERGKIQRHRISAFLHFTEKIFVFNSNNMWNYIIKLDYKAIFNIKCL